MLALQTHSRPLLTSGMFFSSHNWNTRFALSNPISNWMRGRFMDWESQIFQMMAFPEDMENCRCIPVTVLKAGEWCKESTAVGSFLWHIFNVMPQRAVEYFGFGHQVNVFSLVLNINLWHLPAQKSCKDFTDYDNVKRYCVQCHFLYFSYRGNWGLKLRYSLRYCH